MCEQTYQGLLEAKQKFTADIEEVCGCVMCVCIVWLCIYLCLSWPCNFQCTYKLNEAEVGMQCITPMHETLKTEFNNHVTQCKCSKVEWA